MARAALLAVLLCAVLAVASAVRVRAWRYCCPAYLHRVCVCPGAQQLKESQNTTDDGHSVTVSVSNNNNLAVGMEDEKASKDEEVGGSALCASAFGRLRLCVAYARRNTRRVRTWTARCVLVAYRCGAPLCISACSPFQIAEAEHELQAIGTPAVRARRAVPRVDVSRLCACA